MIRASIAAAALALAACGGGGGGGIETPVTAAAQPAAGNTPSAPIGNTAPAPSSDPTPAAPAGLAASPPDVANTTLAGNQNIRSVGALASGGYAVAWMSTDAAGNASLLVQRYDAQGAKSGAETRIAYDVAAQENPAIAVLRDGSAMVASVKSAATDASTVTWTVFARRFDANGSASGNDVTVASFVEHPVGATVHQSLAQPTLLALADGGVAVGWASVDEDDRGKMNTLHAQRFDVGMNAVGAPTDFAADGIDSNIALKLVALPGGDFIAGTTHRFEGIPYVRFRIGMRDVGPLFDANAGLPELNTTLLPLADGRLVLWSTGSGGGYMQALDAAGRAMGAASAVAVVPETAMALPDGGWVTVTRQMPGLPSLAQRFDGNGATVGDKAELAPDMSRPLPTASMGNSFALAWTFTGALGDADIRTQRIEAK
jgi:hypothetical protein